VRFFVSRRRPTSGCWVKFPARREFVVAAVHVAVGGVVLAGSGQTRRCGRDSAPGVGVAGSSGLGCGGRSIVRRCLRGGELRTGRRTRGRRGIAPSAGASSWASITSSVAIGVARTRGICGSIRSLWPGRLSGAGSVGDNCGPTSARREPVSERGRGGRAFGMGRGRCKR
jgi:hypothetical protein